jgi:hypothetical protein
LYRILARKPLRKWPLGRQKRRWKSNKDILGRWMGFGGERWKFLKLWILLL